MTSRSIGRTHHRLPPFWIRTLRRRIIWVPILLGFIGFGVPANNVSAQNDSVSWSERRAEKKREKEEAHRKKQADKEYEELYDALFEKHFNAQSEDVKRRMKKAKKKARRDSRGLSIPWWRRIWHRLTGK